ncbi:MAG: hypothetical protein CMJ78_22070 [Planctomycetaceae bacterium]|nr:hypothetical protein [Planctomycetaceae bacterium]
MSLVEMIVSTVLLVAVFSAAAPVMSWSMQQQSLAGKRRVANQEVFNLMELATANSWESVNSENLSRLSLSSEAQKSLSDADLEWAVTAVDSQPEAKKIAVTLKWKDKQGRQLAPTRLTSWIYRKEATP